MQLGETAFVLAMRIDLSNYNSLASDYEESQLHHHHHHHDDVDDDEDYNDDANYPKISYDLATVLIERGAIVTDIIYPVYTYY